MEGRHARDAWDFSPSLRGCGVAQGCVGEKDDLVQAILDAHILLSNGSGGGRSMPPIGRPYIFYILTHIFFEFINF